MHAAFHVFSLMTASTTLWISLCFSIVDLRRSCFLLSRLLKSLSPTSNSLKTIDKIWTSWRMNMVIKKFCGIKRIIFFVVKRKIKRSDSVLHCMTKNPIPTENLKTNGQHNRATKNVDYTTIADRLRTVSRSNNIHSTGVVKPGLKVTNLPTHRKRCAIHRKWQK